MPTSVALGNHFEESVTKLFESGRLYNVSDCARSAAAVEGRREVAEIGSPQLKSAVQDLAERLYGHD